MNETMISSSLSSSSSSNTSSPVTIRGDGLPYGTNIVATTLRLPSDDELRNEGIEKLIQRLRFCESEHKKLLLERSRVMKEVNSRLQLHLVEVRSLRDVNLKVSQEKDHLVQEKEELSGMCCFLDDDREKAKKMAREWQVFGRYATGVLQKELSQCHAKIRDLEQRQQGFLLENRNLKELCLLLDQQQAGSRTSLDSQGSFHGPIPGLLGVAGTRDSGDGSSNGSAASPDHRSSSLFQKENNSEGRETYVHYLESKVHQLEDEVKDRLKKKLPSRLREVDPATLPVGHPAQSKPEPFLHALKVLDLHDHLGKSLPNSLYPSALASNDGAHLGEQHKEIVREMCNVVWRKLGDGANSNGHKSSPQKSRTLQHRSASVSNL